MDGHLEVYEHALVSARAKRALLALATAFALVIGLWTVPAHAADGLVAGTVTDADGDPLSDVPVEVLWLHNTSDPHFDHVGYDETDATGQFAIHAPPGTVRVSFLGDDDHAGEWYDDVATFQDATDLTLTSGGSLTADAQLVEYGSLDGHVDLATGDPRARAVALLDPATGAVRSMATVHANGDYAFANVVPGSYKVSFNRLSGFALSAAQFWEATGEHLGLGTADVVTIDPAEVVSGVDATLVEGGHITGVLRDQAGGGLSCRLQAYTADGTLVTRTVASAADGSFDLSGLTSGDYLVRVLPGQACENGRQYVTSASGPLSPAGGEADPVAVTIGAITALTVPLVYQMGLLSNVTSPALQGSPTVGSVLTASPGTWTVPDNLLTFRYEWLVDGVQWWSSWSNSVYLDEEFEGAMISVRVRATRAGYPTRRATSAPVGPVARGLTNLAPPVINGFINVGGVVQATPGTWAEPGVTVRYRWHIGNTTLQDSADPRLVLPEATYGQAVFVTVTASKPGFADTRVTGSSVIPVGKGPLTMTKKGKVKGKREVGGKVRVKHATFSAAPTGVTYRWQRDGRTIAGAKGPTYKIVAKDVGHKITVLVTYSRPPAYRSTTVLLWLNAGPIGRE